MKYSYCMLVSETKESTGRGPRCHTRNMQPRAALAATNRILTNVTGATTPRMRRIHRVERNSGPNVGSARASPISTTKVLLDMSSVALEDVSSTIADLFRSLDLDGSGTLSRGEFKTGCQQMGHHLTDTQCDNWIAEADVDGNGMIDLEEFEHIIRAAHGLQCESHCTICCMKTLADSSAATRTKVMCRSHSDTDLLAAGGEGFRVWDVG